MAKWLVKANDDVLSHCRCEAALAAGPGQLDCPWCGCGWLLTCIECRKAFTFARVVETDLTYEQIARRHFVNGGYEVSDDQVADAADWLGGALDDFALGEIVVCLDGRYFRVSETDIEFEGDHAVHNLSQLPHALALDHPARLDAMLGDAGYWMDRERPDRDKDD